MRTHSYHRNALTTHLCPDPRDCRRRRGAYARHRTGNHSRPTKLLHHHPRGQPPVRRPARLYVPRPPSPPAVYGRMGTVIVGDSARLRPRSCSSSSIASMTGVRTLESRLLRVSPGPRLVLVGLTLVVILLVGERICSWVGGGG